MTFSELTPCLLFIHPSIHLYMLQILTQCSGGGGGNTTAANCTATARVTPHVYGSSKGRGVKAGHFTYRLTVRCPVPKRAGERAGATPLPKLADFALQLPEHLYAQTKSLRVKPKALALPSPVVDEGGLLTWTVPNPPRQFSFKILLTPTACIPAPELTGLLCIDNDCQSVPLVKQVRWCGNDAWLGAGQAAPRSWSKSIHSPPHLHLMMSTAQDELLKPLRATPRPARRRLHHGAGSRGRARALLHSAHYYATTL